MTGPLKLLERKMSCSAEENRLLQMTSVELKGSSGGDKTVVRRCVGKVTEKRSYQFCWGSNEHKQGHSKLVHTDDIGTETVWRAFLSELEGSLEKDFHRRYRSKRFAVCGSFRSVSLVVVGIYSRLFTFERDMLVELTEESLESGVWSARFETGAR